MTKTAEREKKITAKSVTVAAVCVLFACQSAPAVPEFGNDGKGNWFQVNDKGALVQAVAPKKVPFALRHPKLHRIGRKIRRTCQVLNPVVQFAGSAACVVKCFY